MFMSVYGQSVNMDTTESPMATTPSFFDSRSSPPFPTCAKKSKRCCVVFWKKFVGCGKEPQLPVVGIAD